MRKIFFFQVFLILFCFQSNANAQQMMRLVKNKIEDHLMSTLTKSGQNRFLGGIEILDTKDVNGYTYIKGTFKYRKIFIFGDDETVIKKFRAKVKMVLDDISVICFSYVGVNEGCYFYTTDSKTGESKKHRFFDTTNSECYIPVGDIMDPCSSF